MQTAKRMASNVYTSPALTFELIAKCSTTRARASILTLPHGPVQLPIFMPVATQASLKGITPEQLEDTGCRLCLNNTYHLGLKPGQEILDAIGGAHKLQGWNHNLLTDSGGFQMVSLLKLATITEEGLDDVLVTTSPDKARMREAMERSNLFCIIQGGLDLEMRRECCKEMLARDTPGIAIGGLSGGEAKADYCRVVETCTALLPDLKPRYVMGIGYPEDLIVSVALGADMFDCVWPTRTARFGNAVTKNGVLNIRNFKYANDFGPIEPGCGCMCCREGEDGMGITRAFIHHNASKETVAAHLLTIHNVWYQLQLMRDIRQAVIEDRFPALIREFFAGLYEDKTQYPEWAVEALKRVNVDLTV
ncbi:queuine tRNA-ribosyltransferase domain-containing protein [Trichoderma breve]|uniref:Queuine tRNA-ribosyltransferase domain-containing protein n=1 Tax=Trichoderma breve TaxID=2034170 RepID=A0A9W9BCL0_9HYPO|nr:queuine tRNA-ribosyltransferase domain-containing protein [Trichoderma breve]KAJ4857096.1 queuine tRNA-ribosyltransferase domain-containing protein [Trichoderma breve]